MNRKHFPSIHKFGKNFLISPHLDLIEEVSNSEVLSASIHPFSKSSPVITINLLNNQRVYLRGAPKLNSWLAESAYNIEAIPVLYEILIRSGVSVPQSLIGDRVLPVEVSYSSGEIKSEFFVLESEIPGKPLDHYDKIDKYKESLAAFEREIIKMHNLQHSIESSFARPLSPNRTLLSLYEIILSNRRFVKLKSEFTDDWQPLIQRLRDFIVIHSSEFDNTREIFLQNVFAHGDLSAGNILFHDGRAGLIDFEMCGIRHLGEELAPLVQYLLRDNMRDKIAQCLWFILQSSEMSVIRLQNEKFRRQIPHALISWGLLSQLRFWLYLAEQDPNRIALMDFKNSQKSLILSLQDETVSKKISFNHKSSVGDIS